MNGTFGLYCYRDAPKWAAMTRGTDLITLIVAAPTLVTSLLLTARGARRAQIVWLGALAYALYTYAIFAFDITFNALFLIYMAAFSLSLFSLVALLARMDVDDLRACFAPSLPVRRIAGIRLWQRRSWGHLLAGMLLVKMTVLGMSVVSGTLFEYSADPKVSLGVVPMFTAVTLVGLWLMVRYFALCTRHQSLGCADFGGSLNRITFLADSTAPEGAHAARARRPGSRPRCSPTTAGGKLGTTPAKSTASASQ